ncbi:snoRNA-binding rRNA-processing protein [Saccharomycopsis crataegensis]|uniref:SnoRNA-binding rRNA-processing protein n=1 Tax=Saccharomycopsis crataegensis TaxID=43959 RepID=A0AAV5QMU7_9ASCO|nr:snoRNA-binding rRNA-processing protein [Saccharomycopsis crataegensis]
MGKATATSSKKKAQHSPLYRDITEDGGRLRENPRASKKSKSLKGEKDEEYIDAATSRKILQLAKVQQEELEEEENMLNKDSNITSKYRFQVPEDSEEEEDSDEADAEEFETLGEYDDADEEIEEHISEEDAKLFEQYLNSQKTFDGSQSYNLADKIMAEIENKKSQLQRTEEGEEEERGEGVMLPPKVIAAYTQIGEVLSTWTHGKLPKLFKIIPTLNNWEDVLYVTNTPSWSPHAVYEATRLFVSNLGAKEAEKFIYMVLLERFRNDIADDENHKLNYHLYRALKKALYKPSAFFKGFLFPLVETGCTSHEAKIAASILSKISIPVLHSSVALSHLLTLEYHPAIIIFICTLIEKKYALPYQTVDDLVFYFMKFRRAANANGDMMDVEDDVVRREQKLTVGWYKAFLAFAQRYKNDITDDQRDFLLETIRQRFHNGFGPEIRRELLAGKPRMSEGIKETEPEMMDIF